MRRLTLSSALLVAAGLARVAAAQDSHYWTYGYGPIGQLTRGHAGRRRERPVGDVLQPGGLRADRPTALRLQRYARSTSRSFERDRTRPAAGLDVDQLALAPGAGDARLPHRTPRGRATTSRSRSSRATSRTSTSATARATCRRRQRSRAAGYGRFKQSRPRVLVRRQLVATGLAHACRSASRPSSRSAAQRSRRSLAAEQLAPDLAARRVRRDARTSTTTCACSRSSASRGGRGPGQLGATLTAPGLQGLTPTARRTSTRPRSSGTGRDAARRPRTQKGLRGDLSRALVGRGRARRGASSARRCTRRSSGSRPSPPTTSCSRAGSGSPWRAGGRHPALSSAARPRAS